MPRPGVVYVISNMTGRDYPFQWAAQSSLSRDFDLSFALLNPGESKFEDYMREVGARVIRFDYRGRKDLPRVILQLARYFGRERTQAVHTHLFDANVAGLSAAMAARVPTRVYTRHHSTVNHFYYPRAVYYDRVINAMATDIIATNQNVRSVLQDREAVPASKVSVIPYAFRLELFGDVPAPRVEALRDKFGVRGRGPIVGVIAKYIEWKGIQHVIPAFKQVLQAYPQACLLIANAQAKEAGFGRVLKAMLSELPAESYREIVFEEDYFALYRLFDVFVHTPIDPYSEAFGQIYVESMASRVPAVFTLSGIAREIAEHERNALVVPFKDPDAVAQAVLRLLADPALGSRLATQARKDMEARFGAEPVFAALGRVYASRARR